MPRYYFHIHDGMSQPDVEGTKLADLEAAKSEAIKLAAAVLRNGYANLCWNGTPWRLDVRDRPEPGGQALLVLNFFASRTLEPRSQHGH
jgi:hypothetical protein